jgi:hypothetical protein
MPDTLTLTNVGSSAYEVTSTNGSTITVDTTVDNPTITLGSGAIGTRYIFYNDAYPQHPLRFRDSNGDILLSQSSTGTFESDSAVNWVDTDSSVEFTLTAELSDQLAEYQCTVHSAMRGTIDSPQTIDYTPATGSVSLTAPTNGATVQNPVSIQMSATNFTVEPASNGLQDGAGHLHILIDQPAVTPGEIIPNNPSNGYYHYGGGATQTELDLATGARTIRVQAGDANHRAYDLTDSVDVTVESTSTSGQSVTVSPIPAAPSVQSISVSTPPPTDPDPVTGSITGTVTTQEGDPVPNARVAVFLSDGTAGEYGTVKWTETDTTGTFTISDHPDAQPQTVQQWHVAQESDKGDLIFNSRSQPYIAAKLSTLSLPSGAVARWRTAAGSGTTLTDSIGSNDGTIDGAEWVSGTWLDGSALSYTASNADRTDMSTVPAIDTDSAFSVAVTVEIQGEGQVIHHQTSDSNRFAMRFINGVIGAQQYDGNDFFAGDGVSVGQNTKYRVVYTFDGGSTGTLYANGSTGSGTGKGTTISGETGLSFGCRLDGEKFFDGIIDDPIIFDRELSSEDVQADYELQPWS